MKKVIKKMIKVALFFSLGLVVVVVAFGTWIYFYLKPDEVPPRVASPDTVRQVENGELIGFEDEYGTYAWVGIPFAEPPVGELRWKAPRPPRQWQGQFEALEFGSICLQRDKGSEDCLSLNIWAPGAANSTNLLPVMFWVHGGGNTGGEGSGIIYHGSHMSGKYDVVVVTINYRLGPFGWFSHPALQSDEASPEDNSGNWGTLDIIQALRWVQDNIAAFGGHPGNVTIFGESAGGTNVLTMMASPLAEGLFHRAIVQSGGLHPVPIADAQNYVDDEVEGGPLSSREIVNNLLVNDGSAADRDAAKALQEETRGEEIGAYVRGKSPEEIFAACEYEGPKDSKVGLPTVFADGHVLPDGMTNAEIFSDTANYNAVPVILGSNRDESKLFMMMDDDYIDTFIGFPVGFKDEAGYERITRYSSDLWKVDGVDSLAASMRQGQGESVFAYRFDVDDWRSFGPLDLKKWMGAAHALEVAFVFGNFPNSVNILSPNSTIAARDRLSESMMSYWAEFAYMGDPGRGRSGNEVAWTAWQNIDEGDLRLLILDTEIDRGIRMSSERVTMANVKARFLADPSYTDQQKYCEDYKMLFQGEHFVKSEYENLGNGGCP
jgi:para-nitrobenzyl esterase